MIFYLICQHLVDWFDGSYLFIYILPQVPSEEYPPMKKKING